MSQAASPLQEALLTTSPGLPRPTPGGSCHPCDKMSSCDAVWDPDAHWAMWLLKLQVSFSKPQAEPAAFGGSEPQTLLIFSSFYKASFSSYPLLPTCAATTLIQAPYSYPSHTLGEEVSGVQSFNLHSAI